MRLTPKISVCVPTHDMKNGAYFLDRLVSSLDRQTYRNFELVITKEGKMAENTNAAIKKAKGDIVKILYMDDFFASPDALQHIADNFKGGWLVSGCVHTHDGEWFINPHIPKWDSEILWGKNTIGSPSVLAFENNDPLLFDEHMSWLLDCELYHRLYGRYGLPTIVEDLDIAIGLGEHQTSNIMSDREKLAEHDYIKTKYA